MRKKERGKRRAWLKTINKARKIKNLVRIAVHTCFCSTHGGNLGGAAVHGCDDIERGCHEVAAGKKSTSVMWKGRE